MTNREKFLTFIDERIMLSSSDKTDAVYRVVKHFFIIHFPEKDDEMPSPKEVIKLISAAHGLKIVKDTGFATVRDFPGIEHTVKDAIEVAEKWHSKMIELDYEQNKAKHGKSKEKGQEGQQQPG